MPSLPSDTITLPLLPRSFVRSSPQRMYKPPRTMVEIPNNVTPIRSTDDLEEIHNESVVEIYNNMTEWKKILLWVALAAALLFVISLLICICHCCCRRRHVVKGADTTNGAPKHLDDNSDAASTISNISGPLNVAAPRPMTQSVSPGEGMVDISLKTPGPNGPANGAGAGQGYGYGMFVNTQRNITGLAPPQKTATYGNMPADPWKSPADRFGGPSASYMS
ncbi:hypothetical protein BD289DRAFT_449178 [Coniella lustricola]|uniref:Uncharacterized protein n=1 Tax=Coniella lustricola TaxID=2025994 RepID=A0A2T3ANU2_9PEZI|nr:hypothetical protein BD289DRAFT_449178 [Coniella lustricola]